MTDVYVEAAATSEPLSRAQDVRFWLVGGRRAIDRAEADRWCRVDLPARALGAKVCLLGHDDLDVEHANGGVAVFRLPVVEAELRAMRYVRKLEARVLLDVDDHQQGERLARRLALSSLPVDHSRAQLRRQLERVRLMQAQHVSALRFADGVLCASRELVETYRRLNANVHYCPNQVDPQDWPDLATTCLTRETSSHDVFRIGFAGSSSHVDDLHLIRDALEWASEQHDVEVICVGFHPGDVVLEHEHEEIDELVMSAHDLRPGNVADDSREGERRALLEQASEIAGRAARRWAFPISVVPWANSHERFVSNLTRARLDVGLCPVDDSSMYARYRSDLKPLEYAMGGALPLVSRSTPYVDWLERVPSASNSQGFSALVRWAVEHRDEVRERALELREYVLRERTIEGNLWRWEEALPD